jgi:hypothetical protein
VTEKQDSYDVAIFRKFAQKATKNSHNALKTCWTILFTGGTFALLHSFDDLIDCKIYSGYVPSELADPSHCQDIFASYSYFFLSAVLFVVYVLTFYRFYVGNIRVFDMVYDEVFEYVASLHERDNQAVGGDDARILPEEIKKEQERIKNKNDSEFQQLLTYSDSLMKWESFYLIVTVLIIVYLTVSPLNPLKFLIIYFALLVADIIWSADYFWSAADVVRRKMNGVMVRLRWVNAISTRNRGEKTRDAKKAREYFKDRFFEIFPKLEDAGFERMFPSHAMRIWHINNLWCLYYIGLFLGCYLLFDSRLNVPSDWSMQQRDSVALSLQWCGAIVAFANCIIDLWLARDFYNPKFSEGHQILIDGSKQIT